MVCFYIVSPLTKGKHWVYVWFFVRRPCKRESSVTILQLLKKAPLKLLCLVWVSWLGINANTEMQKGRVTICG